MPELLLYYKTVHSNALKTYQSRAASNYQDCGIPVSKREGSHEEWIDYM